MFLIRMSIERCIEILKSDRVRDLESENRGEIWADRYLVFILSFFTDWPQYMIFRGFVPEIEFEDLCEYDELHSYDDDFYDSDDDE